MCNQLYSKTGQSLYKQNRYTMEGKDESFRSFTYEKELERAKWFQQNLNEGGWREVHHSSEGTYWIKTFPHEEVPIKVLFTFDIPTPAETFANMLNPSKQEIRKRWDKTFYDHETLEIYPDNGGYVTFMRTETPWPLTDRGFVFFIPPTIEVDWYGKKSFLILYKNAWHPSKPEGEDGLVRATNGGNFFIATPDEKNPEASCNVFGLSHNNYNGCLPKRGIEWLVGRALPRTTIKLRENMIEGYQKYFAKAQE